MADLKDGQREDYRDWRDAFMAAIASGRECDYAKVIANQAVECMKARRARVLAENRPTEIKGC